MNRVYVIKEGRLRVIDHLFVRCKNTCNRAPTCNITHPERRMDSQELQKLNALLDREVDLREVNFLVLNTVTPLLNIPQSIKEQVNELDKKTRIMVGLLNKIHSTPLDASQSYPPPSYNHLSDSLCHYSTCFTEFNSASAA